MSQLNLLNASSAVALSTPYRPTASLADALTVPTSHCYLLKKIRAAAIDANSYTIDVVLLKSGGSARYLVQDLPVPAAGGVDVWSGSLPLDEGDKIQALASTNAKVDLTFAGFDLS